VRYECPPNVDAALRAEIEATARKVYEILECRDAARIDFRLSEDGLLHFIEINPLPGLAPGYSDFPMLAAFSGIDYDTLVQSVLAAALKRHGLRFSLRGGGGYA
jgi:D-alanine-D-alanine ligase